MKRKKRSANLNIRGVAFIQSEERKKKKGIKTEDSFRDLWSIKRSNIFITGVPEGEERKKKGKKLYLRK